MINKKIIGILVTSLMALALLCTGVFTYLNSPLLLKTCVLNVLVGAFGIYSMGSIFFNYSVTYRTTTKPTDSLFQRVLLVGVGLFMWAASIYFLLKKI